LIGFVGLQLFDAAAIRKSGGVYLFLEHGLVLVVERVSVSSKRPSDFVFLGLKLETCVLAKEV